MYKTSKEVLGHPDGKTPDWFWEPGDEIEHLMEEKRHRHHVHLQENSVRSKAALNAIKSKVQRKVQALKNDWWQRKAKELE